MLIIQIVLLLFFLLAIVKVAERYRGGEVSAKEAGIWVVFWFLAGLVVVSPDSTFFIAHLVGVGRGADLVVYLALATIFFLLFRSTIRIERLNRDITKLTRRLALSELKNKK